jgi:hypothetical protein
LLILVLSGSDNSLSPVAADCFLAVVHRNVILHLYGNRNLSFVTLLQVTLSFFFFLSFSVLF